MSLRTAVEHLRVARALYVADRAGPRSRVPVFDAPVLAAFATDPVHQLAPGA